MRTISIQLTHAITAAAADPKIKLSEAVVKLKTKGIDKATALTKMKAAVKKAGKRWTAATQAIFDGAWRKRVAKPAAAAPVAPVAIAPAVAKFDKALLAAHDFIKVTIPKVKNLVNTGKIVEFSVGKHNFAVRYDVSATKFTVFKRDSAKGATAVASGRTYKEAVNKTLDYLNKYSLIPAARTTPKAGPSKAMTDVADPKKIMKAAARIGATDIENPISMDAGVVNFTYNTVKYEVVIGYGGHGGNDCSLYYVDKPKPLVAGRGKAGEADVIAAILNIKVAKERLFPPVKPSAKKVSVVTPAPTAATKATPAIPTGSNIAALVSVLAGQDKTAVKTGTEWSLTYTLGSKYFEVKFNSKGTFKSGVMGVNTAIGDFAECMLLTKKAYKNRYITPKSLVPKVAPVADDAVEDADGPYVATDKELEAERKIRKALPEMMRKRLAVPNAKLKADIKALTKVLLAAKFKFVHRQPAPGAVCMVQRAGSMSALYTELSKTLQAHDFRAEFGLGGKGFNLIKNEAGGSIACFYIMNAVSSAMIFAGAAETQAPAIKVGGGSGSGKTLSDMTPLELMELQKKGGSKLTLRGGTGKPLLASPEKVEAYRKKGMLIN